MWSSSPRASAMSNTAHNVIYGLGLNVLMPTMVALVGTNEGACRRRSRMPLCALEACLLCEYVNMCIGFKHLTHLSVEFHGYFRSNGNYRARWFHT